MSRQQERVHVGHAVYNKKIRMGSISQVKLFDPDSDGCNRKWFYGYVEGIKLVKTGALKEGGEGAEKLEHYFKTLGKEDVLPPVLRPAKGLFPQPGPDIQSEEPLGPDYPMAVFLRDHLNMPEYAHRQDIKDAIKYYAGLAPCDIPFEGAPDIRHFRDHYINDDGIPYREHPGTVVIKIDDLKMVSRIYPQKIMSGPNAGMILPSYAKTSAQVCDDIQMLGYARRDCDVYPEATHFRLGHVYANKSKREAVRRSGIISREEVLKRWSRVEEKIVPKMIQVATADRIEDVEPTVSSCDSFTHVVSCGAPLCGEKGADPGTIMSESGLFLPCPKCKGKGKTEKGCGHQYYCPRSNTAVVQNLIAPHKKETNAMSLFNTLPPGALPPGFSGSTAAPSTPAPAPAPAPSPTEHAAAVAAEKEKLREQERQKAGVVPLIVYGTCACGTEVNSQNASRLADSTVKHIGCAQPAQKMIAIKMVDESAPPPPPPPAPPVPVTTAVLSSDAPPPAPLLFAANPVPAAVAQEIVDPALRATIEQHSQQHAAMVAQQAAEEEKRKQEQGSNVWCIVSGSEVRITTEMAMTKKFVCSCTKAFSTKEAAKQSDGGFVLKVPRHKPKNKVNTMAVEPGVPPPPPLPTEEDEDEAIASENAAPPLPAPPPPPAQLSLVPPAPPVVAAPPPPPPAAPVAPEVPLPPAIGVAGLPTNGHTHAERDPRDAHRWVKDPHLITLQNIENTLKELVALLKARDGGK